MTDSKISFEIVGSLTNNEEETLDLNPGEEKKNQNGIV